MKLSTQPLIVPHWHICGAIGRSLLPGTLKGEGLLAKGRQTKGNYYLLIVFVALSCFDNGGYQRDSLNGIIVKFVNRRFIALFIFLDYAGYQGLRELITVAKTQGRHLNIVTLKKCTKTHWYACQTEVAICPVYHQEEDEGSIRSPKDPKTIAQSRLGAVDEFASMFHSERGKSRGE